jgi:molybdate transport system permease protein
VVETLVDVPIVLPPLVVGLALLILFSMRPLRDLERIFPVTGAIPSVVLAQFAVATAFAVRTMRVTFDQIHPRTEAVALTLGCSRGQAFWQVALPQARRGILAAGTLAWARSLGEFGPILIFSGTTKFRTEVLPTSIWLQFQESHLETALAVSIMLVLVAGISAVVRCVP